MLSIPVFNVLGIWGYRIWMLMVTILFLFSFILLTCTLFRTVSSNDNALYLLTFVCLLYILGFNSLDELFYWFNASNVYTAPICCSLFSLYCYMSYKATSSSHNKLVIMGSILAFFAVGGALCISTFTCAALCLFSILDYYSEKTVHTNSIISLSALVGTVINIIAPGNFIRKSQTSANSTVIAALRNSFYRVNSTISIPSQIGFILCIGFIVFFLSYRNKAASGNDNTHNNSTFHMHPLLISLYCYLSIIVTDLPVLYGYGNGEAMNDRCAFIESISIVFFVSITSAYWGNWVAINNTFIFTKEHIFIIALICFVVLSSYVNIHNLEELTPYKMIVHMVGSKNDFADNANKQKSVIQQIIESDDDDVIVYIDKDSPDEWYNTRTIGINDDPQRWVNANVANYYGKNSVTLILEENDEE